MKYNNHAILYFDATTIHLICNGDCITYAWFEFKLLLVDLAALQNQQQIQIYLDPAVLLFHKIKAPESLFRRLQLVVSKTANKNLLESITIKKKLLGFWQNQADLIFCFALNDVQAQQFSDLDKLMRARISSILVLDLQAMSSAFRQTEQPWLWLSEKSNRKMAQGNKIDFARPKAGAVFQPISNKYFLIGCFILILPMMVAASMQQYSRLIIPIATEILTSGLATTATNDTVISFKFDEQQLRLDNQISLSKKLLQYQSDTAQRYNQLSSISASEILLDEINYSHDSLSIAGSVKSISDFYAFTTKLTSFGGIITLNDLKKIRDDYYYFSLSWSELAL